MCEGLFFPETIQQNLNSSECRGHCSFVGTCDNCQTKEEKLSWAWQAYSAVLF